MIIHVKCGIDESSLYPVGVSSDKTDIVRIVLNKVFLYLFGFGLELKFESHRLKFVHLNVLRV